MLITGIEDELFEELKRRAQRSGRSVEEEARSIIVAALSEPDDLARGIHEAFRRIGGVDLELPSRSSKPRAADFGQ